MSDISFKPGAVRYIKLGRGGEWAATARETGRILLGYHEADHADCLAGRWDVARNCLIEIGGKSPSGASRGVKEIKTFYTEPDDTLWISFADGHLLWCFADGGVVPLPDVTSKTPSRYRPTRDGWHARDLKGDLLRVQDLSSALTRTGSYQGTVCGVERADYLLRRIRAEPEPIIERTRALQEELKTLTTQMITQLHWQDFESLVDLIFARDGWQRKSVLGGNQPDVDFILHHRTSGRTAWVQVKSKADQREVDDYLGRFQRDGSYDLLYFVYAQSSASLRMSNDPRCHLWTGGKLSGMAIEAGLLDWLIERTR